jgi:hypothetical protein
MPGLHSDPGHPSVVSVLSEYSSYYNTSLPNQGIEQQTPVSLQTQSSRTIHRRTILGGIINDYTDVMASQANWADCIWRD